MGFIPIFITLGSFFFLWAAIIYYTFRNYKERAKDAAARRAELGNSLATLPTPDLIAQGQSGTLPAPLWQAEYAFRTARLRYNRLLREAPYSVFGRAFGFTLLD